MDQASLEARAFWDRVEVQLKEMRRDWAWLSREAGMTPSGISAMVKKPRVPRVGEAIKIAKAIVMDFEQLVTGKTEARDELHALNNARGDLTPEQLGVLRLWGRLSIREREGIYSLLATLAGVDEELGDLKPSSETVHQPAKPFRGQEG